MTVTPETLQALIDDSKVQLFRAQRALDALNEQVERATLERDTFRHELETFEASFVRRFPSAQPGPQLELPAADDRPEPLSDPIADFTARYDWQHMSRVFAVERAVEEMTAREGEASPESVQAFLIAQGRVEVRPDIGNALSHLHRTHKIERLGRGRWVPRGLSRIAATAASTEEA